MYSLGKFKDLTSKYGEYSSWAVWDKNNLGNYSVINENIDKLHSKYVLLALNLSGPLIDKPWGNFHYGPSNVRKIMYACDGTELWGAYMTDIFKGIVEQKSQKLNSLLTKEIIEENVKMFNQEMKDVGITKDTKFIVFGTTTSFLAQCFNKYFRQGFSNEVIYQNHYSYYGITDKEWVESFWKKLGINRSLDLST